MIPPRAPDAVFELSNEDGRRWWCWAVDRRFVRVAPVTWLSFAAPALWVAPWVAVLVGAVAAATLLGMWWITRRRVRVPVGGGVVRLWVEPTALVVDQPDATAWVSAAPLKVYEVPPLRLIAVGAGWFVTRADAWAPGAVAALVARRGQPARVPDVPAADGYAAWTATVNWTFLRRVQLLRAQLAARPAVRRVTRLAIPAGGGGFAAKGLGVGTDAGLPQLIIGLWSMIATMPLWRPLLWAAVHHARLGAQVVRVDAGPRGLWMTHPYGVSRADWSRVAAVTQVGAFVQLTVAGQLISVPDDGTAFERLANWRHAAGRPAAVAPPDVDNPFAAPSQP